MHVCIYTPARLVEKGRNFSVLLHCFFNELFYSQLNVFVFLYHQCFQCGGDGFRLFCRGPAFLEGDVLIPYYRPLRTTVPVLRNKIFCIILYVCNEYKLFE